MHNALITQLFALIHGHGPAWQRPESYAFAKGIVNAGSPWCRQLGDAAGDGRVEATFSSSRTFDRAMLVSTTDTGITGARKWIESPRHPDAQRRRMDGFRPAARRNHGMVYQCVQRAAHGEFGLSGSPATDFRYPVNTG